MAPTKRPAETSARSRPAPRKRWRKSLNGAGGVYFNQATGNVDRPV
jgi:hypothetical protein